MKVRQGRIDLAVAALTFVLAGLGCALRGPAPLISPPQASQLVERKVQGLAVSSVEVDKNGENPTYLVEGSVEVDDYSADVHARVARVLRIRRNGNETYRWDGILVVAHRGSVREAPENTLAAIEKGIENGADLIETDVRETSDGHLVVIHDATVDRTTDGSGRVAEMTLAELKQLDAGSWFDPRFKGERIPTLDEALDAMEGRALPDIDFKGGTPEKLVEALRRRELSGKVTVASEFPHQLLKILDIAPETLARPTLFLGLAGLPFVIATFDPPIVNITWRKFSERLIQEIHLRGRQVFFTILRNNDNEAGMKIAIEAGADYIQSDRLDLLLPLLRERGLHR